MLFIAKQLATASFLIMSDRAEFWDSDKIGKETEAIVNGEQIPADFSSFAGQRVLLLVHGYNNDADEALATYRTIQKNIDGMNLYDAVIGYLWPGCDEKLEYFYAEKNAAELASRAKSHIQNLSQSATHLDILAHSMGNRLMLEALQNASSEKGKKLVRNFYSLAPAVKDNSIEINQPFFRSVEQCEKMFVFHSNRDGVLKIAFFLAERSEALGYKGADNPAKAPENVQFIDCTEFVDGHSDYFNTSSFYYFMQKESENFIPDIMNVKLLKDGMVSKIP